MDGDFILRHFVLHCDPFEGTHDADSIAKTLDEQIGDLNLPSVCEGKKNQKFQKDIIPMSFHFQSALLSWHLGQISPATADETKSARDLYEKKLNFGFFNSLTIYPMIYD